MVIIAHNPKSKSSHADDNVLGSRAFTGLARVTWHLLKDSDDPDRRSLLQGKCNIAAKSDRLAFRVGGEPASIHWEADPVDMSANDALQREADAASAGGSAVDEAASWLRDRLSRGDELATSVKESGLRAGHKERTVERASKLIEVRRYRSEKNGPWWWSVLPENSCPRQENESSPTNPLEPSLASTDFLASTEELDTAEVPEAMPDIAVASTGKPLVRRKRVVL